VFSTVMSGTIPSDWMDRPFGVKYFAVVSRTAEPSPRGI
jgi:hypothetical protein